VWLDKISASSNKYLLLNTFI